jgi:hypothetical protein
VQEEIGQQCPHLQTRDRHGGAVFGPGRDWSEHPEAHGRSLSFWIFPVIVGSGQRLLEGQAMTHLDLLGTTTFKSGIVVHKLAPKA